MAEAVRNDGVGEVRQAGQASFQVLSEREGEDESRLVDLLVPHKVDEDTPAGQTENSTGAHEEDRKAAVAGIVVAVLQEIVEARKHFPGDRRLGPADRQDPLC